MSLVNYQRDGRIARITLNRPEKLNALNDEIVVELRTTLETFDADSEAWIAILSGEGRSFCSGADIQQRQLRPLADMVRLGGPSGRGAAKVRDLFLHFVNWKPVITAVHGYAVGGGLSLALQGDVVVAAENTVFQITEVARGLNGRSLVALMRERGAATFANEAALTARYFSAREAYTHGLINLVVPDGKHLEAATQFAEAIVAHPPLSVRAAVKARRLDLERAVLQTNVVERHDLHLTADFQEAVHAFVEKRAPVYRAR